MKKKVLCLIAFILFCFAGFTQTVNNSFKIDLSSFTTWDKNRDIYNPATGKLTLKEGWGGGGVWFNYTGTYNFLEIKYKEPTYQFMIVVEYDDKSETKTMCKINSNVSYVKLEPKKVKAVKFQKLNRSEMSIVLESFTLVQKKSVADNISKSPIVDKKTGNFNSSITATDLVKQMKVGWNLANVFEAIPMMGWEGTENDPLDFHRSLGTETELIWRNPYTTKEIINFPKSQGYNSIRIPITWFLHITDDNYTIDPEWMARIKEIVDWSIESGYYVIINCHHDVLEQFASHPLKRTGGYNVNSNEADIAESKRFLKAIWTQISAAFNGSYDEHLIFEVMNEPRNANHEHGWQPGIKLSYVDNTKCKECIADYKTLNEFNQLCLDTIRASGGNNAKRFVMIPSLCAGPETALNNYFKLPEDSEQNRLILTVHSYILGAVPGSFKKEFSQQDKEELSNNFSQLNKKFVKKGVPVIVGEASANRFFTPKTERIKWITYLSKLTSKYGMSLLYWDSNSPGDDEYGFDQFDRVNLKFHEPDFVQTMLDNWKCD